MSLTTEPNLGQLLEQSAALHHHLCPRQVLGARMGLLAGRSLGLSLPRLDKRLLIWVETDGCFADGLSVATGCWLGRRTMRLFDQGKIAATFTDTQSGRSLRIAPRSDARHQALTRVERDASKWLAYLEGYQVIPDEALFRVQEVALEFSWQEIVSSKRLRATCAICAEEIVNGREHTRDGQTLCLNCAGERYWSAKT